MKPDKPRTPLPDTGVGVGVAARFLLQLRGELVRMSVRPGSWLAFVVAPVFWIVASSLLKSPAAREMIARDIWKMRARWEEIFSGLTTGTHLLGESLAVAGAVGLCLVAAELVAGEKEKGTLRMILCRPVGRTAVFAAKALALGIYTALLSLFLWAGALAVGLAFEGPGNLVLLAPHEGVMGAFGQGEGLRRYALALPFLFMSAASGAAWPFLFSCTGMRPATVAALALALFSADTVIRTAPQLAVARPYCVTTRLLAWRQVFNEEIPWSRIERNYRQLLAMDAALLVAAWAAFRRLELRG
jgi:ABC-2 type transport system permease protein